MMSDPMWFSSFIIRIVTILTTFVATILVGATEDTVDTVDGYVRVRPTYSSSFQYFIGANAIAFIYSAASTALSILIKRRSPTENPVKMVLMIGDLVVLVLLFSGNGSAAAAAVYERDVLDLCVLSGKVCGNITGAIALSMFAALGYLTLTIIDVVHGRRSSNQSCI